MALSIRHALLARLALQIALFLVLYGVVAAAADPKTYIAGGQYTELNDDSFVMLKPAEEPPQNQFIFAVQNLKTGQMFFGYPTQKATDPSRRVNTVLPGHTKLISQALGISTMEYLTSHMPKEKKGQWIGGGFLVEGDKIILNRYFSLKAAGQLEEFVTGINSTTVNPKAPKVNKEFSAFIHPDYWDRFFSGIAVRFHRPLELEPEGPFDSTRFSFNYDKSQMEHSRWTRIAVETTVDRATENLESVVQRINQRRLAQDSSNTGYWLDKCARWLGKLTDSSN